MLTNQTAEKLRLMRLPAMASEYVRQIESPDMSALDFNERVGMMADVEWTSRENNRIRKLTREANLRVSSACFADVDYRPSRKLDRAYVARLSDFAWTGEAKNLIITGATGTGKTWLACAFGAEACRKGIRVTYTRVSRLISDLTIASGSGSLNRFLQKLKRSGILILDDWGMASLSPLEGRLLLEVFEDRFNEKSTIIAAQIPVAKWHELFEDSTIADAILDRLVHNSHRLELQGPSLRRQEARPDAGTTYVQTTDAGEIARATDTADTGADIKTPDAHTARAATADTRTISTGQVTATEIAEPVPIGDKDQKTAAARRSKNKAPSA